jgi:hypothetical protein
MSHKLSEYSCKMGSSSLEDNFKSFLSWSKRYNLSEAATLRSSLSKSMFMMISYQVFPSRTIKPLYSIP